MMDSTLNRRGLLASLALAGAVHPVPGLVSARVDTQDRELIAACVAFCDLEKQVRAVYGPENFTIAAEDLADKRADPLLIRQEKLLPVICSSRATTLPGLVARARALSLYAPDYTDGADDEGGYWDERMRAALLRDMVELG